MRATTVKSQNTLPQESGLGEVPALARQESNETAPSMESRLWKLAATEMLSFEIETLLLLLVGIFGLITVAYALEQVFSFLQNEPVAAALSHLLQ